ncbi:hypothetical protein MPSEU_000873500 [Mayamaea pseudoterrestris]|nr:hypothetical protein MPSEU_000873500 [Mayamaea pseudoterrestris]
MMQSSNPSITISHGQEQQQHYMQHQQPQQFSQPQLQQVPPPPQQTSMQRPRIMRPPYVDPTTNIIYDTDNAEYEGWLTKQSSWIKEWRRRYFILKGSKLFFAKNEYNAPHGMMDLAHCTTVKSADLKSHKRHSFEISTPDTCYLLYADTESEKDDWIGRVGKAIVRCSRTYYSQGGGGAGATSGSGLHQRQPGGGQVHDYESDDDDIYENDDPNNPYYN